MINVLTVIIFITVIVSLKAFTDKAFMERMLFVPYVCKRERQSWRFFSHMAIHADWGHLLFNMISLYYLGGSLLNTIAGYYSVKSGGIIRLNDGFVEQFGSVSGQAHFALLYLLGGLFSTLWPFVRNQDNPGYRSLGASGAVSAIVFASIIWNPTMPLGILFIPIDIPAYIFGPLYLLFEYFMHRRGGSGIAHDAHIGGAIFGIIYALILDFDKAQQFISHF